MIGGKRTVAAMANAHGMKILHDFDKEAVKGNMSDEI